MNKGSLKSYSNMLYSYHKRLWLYVNDDNNKKVGYVLNGFLIVCFIISVVFRILFIQNIPGINGDEAWYSIQITEFFAGKSPKLIAAPLGRPLINPFFILILLPVTMLFSPSFWILRTPSLIAGILLLPLSYILLRRSLSHSSALITFILAASLPINIAYSRFGWDPSQTALASLFVIHFTFKRNVLGIVLSFIAALFVHPTNIFLFPIILGPYAAEFIFNTNGEKRKTKNLYLFATALVLICLTVIFLQVSPNIIAAIKKIPERFLDFNQWSVFIIYFGRLFTGTTIYSYIVSPLFEKGAYIGDFVFWSFSVVVFIFGGRRILQKKQWAHVGFICGLVLSAALFYLIAGIQGIQPHYERYAVFLVMPYIISVAILLENISLRCKMPRLPKVVGLLLGTMLLYGFYFNYFQFIIETGGQSHRTFRTAPIEPKEHAYLLIKNDSMKYKHAFTIFAQDWHIFMPIRYLISGEKRISAINMKSIMLPETEFRKSLLPGGRAYMIGYASGNIRSLMSGMFSPDELKTWVIKDYAGKDLLMVCRLGPGGIKD